MTNTKHTPGPWVVFANPVTGSHVIGQADGPPIVRLKASQASNAPLIAAAPAMYEALAKLRLEAIHYRNTGIGVQFLNAAIDQAENIINQAVGVVNDTERTR